MSPPFHVSPPHLALSLSFLSVLLHLLLAALNLMQLSLFCISSFFFGLLLLLLPPSSSSSFPSPSGNAHPVHQWSEEVISLQSQERVQTQPDSQQGQWALDRKAPSRVSGHYIVNRKTVLSILCSYMRTYTVVYVTVCTQYKCACVHTCTCTVDMHVLVCMYAVHVHVCCGACCLVHVHLLVVA